jgi:hypothetical protein
MTDKEWREAVAKIESLHFQLINNGKQDERDHLTNELQTALSNLERQCRLDQEVN